MELESSRQLERSAAAAPMAKSRRAQANENFAAREDRPVSNTATAAAIEQWARSCDASSVSLSSPTLWRGLTVTGWQQLADAGRSTTTLRFAPETGRETLDMALGSLAVPATFATAACAAPVTRELRQPGSAWTLVCECTQPAG